MTVPRVIVEADGGSRGNPGPAGYGAVVRDAGTGEVLAERAESLGVTTNNVAEYSGLIAGLTAASDLGAHDVTVRMDSKLVIEQMTGRWQIKHPGLRPLAARAAALLRHFDTITFEWIPREHNRDADALANRAMDAASGRDPGGAGSEVSADRLLASAEASGSTLSGSARSRVSASANPAVATAHAIASWEPRTTEPTRLILLRHGQTAFTEERRYSGRVDVPLSETGIRQAQALAARVARLAGPVAAVLTSPLSRCTATAEAVRAALPGDVAVLVEPDLIECDFGTWEGLTFTEVRERWPVELTRWLDSPAVAPPGGESFRAVAMRTRRFVATLRATYPERTVVAVAHVGPIKALLRDALAAGDAFLNRLRLDAAGLSIIDSWADGGVSVRVVNDTAHLVDI